MGGVCEGERKGGGQKKGERKERDRKKRKRGREGKGGMTEEKYIPKLFLSLCSTAACSEHPLRQSPQPAAC